MRRSRNARPSAGLAALLALLAVGAPAGRARAAGLEVVPGGNQSVARGGANLARAEDATSLARDPAGLAFLEGSSLLLDVNVPLYSMCVDPYGYYGWGAYGSYGRSGSSEFGDELAVDDPSNPTPGATYASTKLPRVCNSAKTIGIPQLLWSTRVGRLAIAAGFVAPVFVPGLQYGGADGTISTPSGPRPTPTRYSLVKQEVLFGLNPTLGVAYRFLPQLSAGLTLQVLSAKARAVAVQNSYAGTQPSTDWLSTVETQDYFLPRVVASVHAKPVRPLDLVVSFEWSDDFRGPGRLTTETNTY
ncbi:MAG: hypothetical protein FJ104_04560, partial [Deltaproteobacteria bacterium]|nr:hypothetical protein [Deltaproteobacteria bacterium]